MIRVHVMDESFNQAYWRAKNELPVEWMERPRQYGYRWRESYKCRIDPSSTKDDTWYIFDRDEDYTWFMLRWG